MDYNGIDIDDNQYFESLGFRCGLEIHQQLATKNKLFCHCPVGLTDAKHDAEILRHMRPTLSELGEYDGTALMEFKTKKEIIYRLYRDRTCTYEMDDTPPFLVNQEAVDYAIRLSLLFNCRIVDEIHVIRKQYLDGSIPTGFQRTMIIGVDGWIPFKGRKVAVRQVNLEEESCREVSDIGHRIVFATDRLSIPLVEIITDAELKNPAEAADVCRLLGNSMKITGLVRRGIGTVRQDVNVSIPGGRRVEIKGVYKVGNIKPLTAIEAERQRHLLTLKEKFDKRFPSIDKIRYREENVTNLFSGIGNIIGQRLESDLPLKVAALYLPNLADIMTTPLQPDRDFAFELSGRVRVIACIDSKPNLMFLSHRDQYDISDKIWESLETKFESADNDDIVLICGPSIDVKTAVNEIKIRIAEISEGIVNETRQDLKDGTTDFERILPGPDRMYPDTDHPPVMITDQRVEKLHEKLGEPLWEKHERWRKLGLHDEQVKALSLSPFADLFDRLAVEFNGHTKRLAHYCTDLSVGLRRNGRRLTTRHDEKLFGLFKDAVSDDWPYRRIKSSLIAIAEGRNNDTVTAKSISDDDFNKIWDESLKSFMASGGNNKNDSEDNFRRYVTGQLLNYFSSKTKDILKRVNQKIAVEKLVS